MALNFNKYSRMGI